MTNTRSDRGKNRISRFFAGLFGGGKPGEEEKGALRRLALWRSIGVLGVRLGGAAANFFYVLVLTRLLPQEDVGLVLTLTSYAFMFSVLMTLNLENVAIRFLQQPLERGDLQSARAFVRHSGAVFLRMLLLVMVAYGLLVFFVAGRGMDIGLSIVLSMLSIPALALLRVGSLYGQAFHKVFVVSLSWGFVRPFLLLAFVVGIAVLGLGQPLVFVFAAFLVSAFLALLVQFFMLRPHMKFMGQAVKAKPASDERRQWTMAGLYLAASVFLLDYFQNTVPAIAALVLPSEDIALLGVVLRFVGVMAMGQMAINAAMGQQISRHHAKGEKGKMMEAIIFANHLRFWPTLGVYGFIFIFAEPLLGIFGEDYREGAFIFRLLGLVPLAACFFGNSIMLLNIYGKAKALVAPALLSTLLLLFAIPVGANIAALSGVAVATLLVMLVFYGTLYLKVRQVTGVRAALFDGLPKRP